MEKEKQHATSPRPSIGSFVVACKEEDTTTQIREDMELDEATTYNKLITNMPTDMLPFIYTLQISIKLMFVLSNLYF